MIFLSKILKLINSFKKLNVVKAFATFFLIKTYFKKLMRFSSIEFNVRNIKIDLKHI
jgi:hypothetical protein